MKHLHFRQDYNGVSAKGKILKRNITDAETYRPIGEIVKKLSTLEEKAAAIDTELKTIFEKLGI